MTRTQSTDAYTSTLGMHALAYAASGLPVVPLFAPDGRGGCSCGNGECRRPGKHPRNRGGLSGASTDSAVVTAWWRTWPNANVGGLTGVVFDVCDVDGPDGIAAVAPLLADRVGAVPLVRTGSGGWHLLFAPTGLGNRVGFLPKTDWRGQGGYVVLPPSVHASGNRYAFARHAEGELPSVPPALLAALAPAAGAAARASLPPAARRGGYGTAALRRETDQLAALKVGRRNDALNRAAFNLGQLVAAGALTETEVSEALTAAALRAGLTASETARTIASGLSAGIRNPRTVRRAA
jgi:hypothetical protein